MLGLGPATMLVGGYRALRQTDLKLLLAFGTVSQLGFLMVLVGAGSAGAGRSPAWRCHRARAVQVHAVPDRRRHRPRHRHPRHPQLSGLGRRLPALARSAASRRCLDGRRPAAARLRRQGGRLRRRSWTAGCPTGPPPAVVLAGLVARVGAHRAYSARFWWGAFAASPALPDRRPAELAHRPAALFLAAPAVLALAGLVLGPASPLLEPAGRRYAETLPLMAPRGRARSRCGTAGSRPSLLSALSLLGGAALFVGRAAVDRLQRRFAVGGSADEGYWNIVQGLDRLAVLVTGTTQRGSLPVYLGTILVVVARAARHDADHPRARGPTSGGLGHPAPGPGRRGHRSSRPGWPLADPAAAVGGPRRRRHRLRRGRPVRPAGRTRPRADPVPGRDADPRRLRAGAAQAAQGHHRAAPPRRARWSAASSRVAVGAFDGRRRRRRARRPDGDAGVAPTTRRRPTSSAAARTSSTSPSSTSAPGTPSARSRCWSWRRPASPA